MGAAVETSLNPTDCNSTVTGARLFVHIKEKRIEYLLGLVLLHLLGVTDKLYSAGVGMCG